MTMQEIWRILTWSFHFLALGKWPHVDPYNKSWDADKVGLRELAGMELADGLRGVIYAVKGDLDHLAKRVKIKTL